MTPCEREGARLFYMHSELVIAARNYFIRSDLTHNDRESLLAAQRLGDLLDAAANQKDSSQ